MALLALPQDRCWRDGRTGGALFDLRAQPDLRLVGFVDDDNFKLGKFVHGYEVLGSLLHTWRPFTLATVSIRFWLRTRWRTRG
jgi:hypothetical protein